MKRAFTNLNLIDGTGNVPVLNASILVENGVITQVGAAVSTEGCEVIDLGGKYVMPGLIDCHVHTEIEDLQKSLIPGAENSVDRTMHMITNLRLLLEHGVTYVRDALHSGEDLMLRPYLKSGAVKGPGMSCCGRAIIVTGGNGNPASIVADGIDECRKAARQVIKDGADHIKVFATGAASSAGTNPNSYQMSTEEMAVIVEEAHKVGKKVMSHAHGTKGIKNSIMAGVDSVEHATILDDEAIQMAVETGTYIVPTLVVVHNILEGAKMGIQLPPGMVEKISFLKKTHGSGIKKAYDAGVKLAMGTDSGGSKTIGKSSQKELELMVEIGIPAAEVITISTKNAADLIGISQTHGTLEQGKVADFLVLNDNPIEDITTIQRLVSVYQGGKLV